VLVIPTIAPASPTIPAAGVGNSANGPQATKRGRIFFMLGLIWNGRRTNQQPDPFDRGHKRNTPKVQGEVENGWNQKEDRFICPICFVEIKLMIKATTNSFTDHQCTVAKFLSNAPTPPIPLAMDAVSACATNPTSRTSNGCVTNQPTFLKQKNPFRFCKHIFQ
jgi:hypothetical protein